MNIWTTIPALALLAAAALPAPTHAGAPGASCMAYVDTSQLAFAAADLQAILREVRSGRAGPDTSERLRRQVDNVGAAVAAAHLPEALKAQAGDFTGGIEDVQVGLESYVDAVASFRKVEASAPAFQLQLDDAQRRRTSETGSAMSVYLLGQAITAVERIQRRGAAIVSLDQSGLVELANGIVRDRRTVLNVLSILGAGDPDLNIKPPSDAEQQAIGNLVIASDAFISAATDLAQRGGESSYLVQALDGTDTAYSNLSVTARAELEIAADGCVEGR